MTLKQAKNNLEAYQYRYADVARCWAKYGLDILSSSKDRLMDDKDEAETSEGNIIVY